MLHKAIPGSSPFNFGTERVVQIGKTCTTSKECVHYDLANRTASAAALWGWPRLEAAAAEIGYRSLKEFIQDAEEHLELIYYMATFCLSPPGDTAKRRGFVEALQMGCIPVVMDEWSRAYPWYLSDDELGGTTILLNAHEVLANSSCIEAQLQRALPRVQEMQVAIGDVVTRLQWSYSDHLQGVDSHIGPDALDVALWHMAKGVKEIKTLGT
jgi:hypothetical protein